jgi:hypothetical protein
VASGNARYPGGVSCTLPCKRLQTKCSSIRERKAGSWKECTGIMGGSRVRSRQKRSSQADSYSSYSQRRGSMTALWLQWLIGDMILNSPSVILNINASDVCIRQAGNPGSTTSIFARFIGSRRPARSAKIGNSIRRSIIQTQRDHNGSGRLLQY